MLAHRAAGVRRFGNYGGAAQGIGASGQLSGAFRSGGSVLAPQVTAVISGHGSPSDRPSAPTNSAASTPISCDSSALALRHFYASVLLDAGENIKALSTYLGHSDPGFALRVYTHLMPSSDHRARNTMDSVYGRAVSRSDGPQTAQGHGNETEASGIIHWPPIVPRIPVAL